MRINSLGILGGCFDPVHLGHLEIAERVRRKLNLDKVLFIPAGYQWLKGHPLSPAHHRLKMLELALSGKPFFDLSGVEIDRPGPSYTVETLRLLKAQYPQAVFYFILGWDALNTFPRWREPGEIIKLSYLVTVPRNNAQKPAPEELEKAVPGIAERLIMLETPFIKISAAQIRERLKKGLDISHLVPPEVEKYIWNHKLYK